MEIKMALMHTYRKMVSHIDTEIKVLSNPNISSGHNYFLVRDLDMPDESRK
jgi:hypothetical protein